MNVRVLIVEDHTMVRQALLQHLQEEPNLVLVGEAEDGLQALDMVEKRKPDVVLLDLSLPRMQGMEVLCRVRKHFPRTRVVVVSMYKEKHYVMKAMDTGAWGYVSKASDKNELIAAIRQVARGERYLCAPFTFQELEEYSKRAKNGNGDLLDLLTPREKQILQLLAEGLTNPAVADKLGIKTRTVESHRSHIMFKLSLRSFAELVRFAVLHGLVDAGLRQDAPFPPGGGEGDDATPDASGGRDAAPGPRPGGDGASGGNGAGSGGVPLGRPGEVH